MSTRPCTPSCFSASFRPLLASALNERSLRPPISVTTPTLICLPPEDDWPPLPPPPPPPLSEPQAAIPKAPRLRERAMAIARNVLRYMVLLRAPPVPGHNPHGCRRTAAPGGRRAAPARR